MAFTQKIWLFRKNNFENFISLSKCNKFSQNNKYGRLSDDQSRDAIMKKCLMNKFLVWSRREHAGCVSILKWPDDGHFPHSGASLASTSLIAKFDGKFSIIRMIKFKIQS